MMSSKASTAEIIGGVEFINPLKARAVVEAKRAEARLRKRLAKRGMSEHEAIERALRRRR